MSGLLDDQILNTYSLFSFPVFTLNYIIYVLNSLTINYLILYLFDTYLVTYINLDLNYCTPENRRSCMTKGIKVFPP